MKLFPHQEECLKQTADADRVAYFLDMGLGKTFVGSEKMRLIGNEMNLVVCQKSKVQDWVNHFKENYPDWIVWNLAIKSEFNAFTTFCVSGFYHVAIINYELAWRRPVLLNMSDFTLMLDESSLIQNKKTKQSKFILKLQPRNVILLSGTPTGGKYENLWTQMHLLGWKISEDLYNRQYVNWKTIEAGGFIHKIVNKDDPYKNVDRLKSKLREHGSVFMKTDEVMDLPDQTFQIINVPTTSAYKKFCKSHLVTVDGVEFVGDSIFSQRLGKRMLCGAYNPNKIQAFRDLLESTQDRLVVFYCFNSELVELIAACNDLDKPYSMVNGSVKRLDEYESQVNSVTLVQYKAGSMGINLQKANKIVYFSLTEESELFEQSKKRIHRIGQDRPCFYYLLVCKNSIEDEEILPTLNLRRDYTDELFREDEENDQV